MVLTRSYLIDYSEDELRADLLGIRETSAGIIVSVVVFTYYEALLWEETGRVLGRFKASDFQTTDAHPLSATVTGPVREPALWIGLLASTPTATSEQAPMTAQLGRCTKRLSLVSPCLSPVLQTTRQLVQGYTVCCDGAGIWTWIPAT